MDMSVKLNLSYSTAKPNSVETDKAAPVPSVSSKVQAPASTGSGSDSDKLKIAVQEIEKFVQSVKRNLEFSIDETSGKVVVKVIASETGEVVRQIPSEEALKLADSLNNAGSLLFNAKA